MREKGLPAKAPQDGAGPHGFANSNGPDGLRVLVVEDNKDCADSTAMLLSMYGHEVVIAGDGPTAVDMAQTFLPDVILLDIGLPGMNGYEVAQKILERPEVKRPLFIAVTGNWEVVDGLYSMDPGIDLHLLKPVDPAALQPLLNRFRAIIK